MTEKGFTLLEVMVALAIFAIAALVLTQVSMQYSQTIYNAELKTKAQFVAMNEQAVMKIKREWLTGTQSTQTTQQGVLWQIDKKSQSTISPHIQRIDLQVSVLDSQTKQVLSVITNLVFFNHKVESNE
ncbi:MULTISPECIES: type II secretion system minor pseudopilin GspI [unclassified Acinetobacter]|uniref:type II secretion system minor pseudopilin GspI n=1 Tax=unclassified Acinetobacter TaxID=196816 RepID=UPI00293415CE|nr:MULTISPECIES: type II secretion system minor pseudopilin GspI [unclassified Acinetobacter]WOE32064.1 type II secretion system minor pseudopilin GspI [Acinetobacter sp. SAAs470]WOE37533.1 type II secretion system minor pseudopilin GspI [Acinetobacter sp. SAAs474]